MIQLKESYAEQERLRAKECEQQVEAKIILSCVKFATDSPDHMPTTCAPQEADMMNLRADLQHERKLRESIEDEMRRARRYGSNASYKPG
jgi:hypothetical protein